MDDFGGMDPWTALDLRLRHALRGPMDRAEGADWMAVPLDNGGIRIVPLRDPLAFVDAIEAMVEGEVG